MKSRPIFLRSDAEYKFYHIPIINFIIKFDVRKKISWVGGIDQLNDAFEIVPSVIRSPKEEVSEARARQLAPHLFK